MEKGRKSKGKECKDQKSNGINSSLSNKVTPVNQNCEIKANGAQLVNNNSPPSQNSTVESASRQNSKMPIPAHEKSRVVYLATACHTCKALPDSSKGVRLSSCAGCRMLNYCCRDHQIEDWKSHKSLCSQIQKILKNENKTHLFDRVQVTTEAEWLKIRYSYMKLLTEQLGRELEAYEKEIFLFPLYFCFSCSQTKLVICDDCHHHHHTAESSKSWCTELQVWRNIVCYECHHGLVKPIIDETCTFPSDDLTQFPNDIQHYFSNITHQDIPLEVWRATIADVATVPLTIIWSLIQFAPHLIHLESLTIHLIGAEMDFEGCCPRKWEFCLFHALKALTTLHLVLVGPELVTGTSTPSLCTTCKDKGRRMTITNKPGLFYHEYKKQKKSYVRPNITCAFNCGIYRKTGFNGQDTWAPTIPLLGSF